MALSGSFEHFEKTRAQEDRRSQQTRLPRNCADAQILPEIAQPPSFTARANRNSQLSLAPHGETLRKGVVSLFSTVERKNPGANNMGEALPPACQPSELASSGNSVFWIASIVHFWCLVVTELSQRGGNSQADRTLLIPVNLQTDSTPNRRTIYVEIDSRRVRLVSQFLPGWLIDCLGEQMKKGAFSFGGKKPGQPSAFYPTH